MDAWSNITLMFSVMDRAENQIKAKDPQEVQRLVVSIHCVPYRRFQWDGCRKL